MEAPLFADRLTAVRKTLSSGFLFAAGVLLPAFTIGFELLTRMCAQSLFDPLPTLAHLAIVVAVPVINLRLWLFRRRAEPVGRVWIVAGAAAATVGFCYALQFMPLYPMAFIAIVFAGIGLLPFAPLTAGVMALWTTIGLARRDPRPAGRVLAAGVLGALILVLALDLPSAVTRVAVRGVAGESAADRAQALALMRRFGDRDLLLRYCYDHSGRSGGLLGLLVEGGLRLTFDNFVDDRQAGITTDAARELYYRVTGAPYNLVEPPFRKGAWEFTRRFQWDRDQGGSVTGGRVVGLNLRSSRIDGSIDADDAVGYLEWTQEFANTGEMMSESRMTLALPPGGVVSRATLWVNGQEREAAFAARGAARAAYESVVMARRDPLLVTTNGADQVFVQMFPVPAHGNAKLRIGITAPLALGKDGRATLALPAIVDRNFSIDGALRHSVWIEGDGREAVSDKGFTRIAAEGAVIRERASVTDEELAKRRPRIALSRNPLAETIVSGGVVQTIRREPREPAGALLILLDGSVSARDAGPALLAAAERIPPGARVGFAIASVAAPKLPLAPWDAARRTELAKLIGGESFSGGEDNLGALADVMAGLEGEPNATLLWIHGPQGFDFPEHVAELEQSLDRSTRLPLIELLPVAPGPNKLLQHPRLFQAARTLAWSGDVRADVAAALDDFFDRSQRWTVSRAPGAAAGLIKGSQHVEKLWARDAIDSLLAQGPEKLEAASQLAEQFRLVTPASGAVVLETNADYIRAGLAPPDAASVPTIPEPSEWALLIVACLAFAWAARRHRLVA